MQFLGSIPVKFTVRELKNVIERVIVFSKRRALDKESVLVALGKKIYHPGNLTTDKKIFSRDEVINALEMAKGNRTHASEYIGVHVTTLHRWIKKFDLSYVVEASMGRPPEGDSNGQT